MITSQVLTSLAVEKSLIDKAYPRPQLEYIQKRIRDIYNIFVIVCIDKTFEPKFAYIPLIDILKAMRIMNGQNKYHHNIFIMIMKML